MLKSFLPNSVLFRLLYAQAQITHTKLARRTISRDQAIKRTDLSSQDFDLPPKELGNFRALALAVARGRGYGVGSSSLPRTSVNAAELAHRRPRISRVLDFSTCNRKNILKATEMQRNRRIYSPHSLSRISNARRSIGEAISISTQNRDWDF